MSSGKNNVLTVELGERSYPIHIADGVLKDSGEILSGLLRSPRVIVISDSNTADLYLPIFQEVLENSGIRCDNITLPAGEALKSFRQLEILMEGLLDCTPERTTSLVALGGGVVGDITGFAASILLRGVDFVQIPTTLLAQVDSSVGGKTGINTSQGKNLVGSFYQPRAVIIDPVTLDSLPKRELLAGYAEMVKYGLLGDVEFFSWLEANGEALLAGDRNKQAYAIAHCCSMKADIVRRDERESGVRELLNLGHTFGHALEAETGYSNRLLHGEAVSIGMVMAAELSVSLGLLEKEACRRIKTHLATVGLPVTVSDIRGDDQWDTGRLLQHMAGDKKVKNGIITLILLRSIGEAFSSREVSEETLRDILAQALDIS